MTQLISILIGLSVCLLSHGKFNINQHAWTRATSGTVVTVSANPTLHLPDGRGGAHAATAEEALAYHNQLNYQKDRFLEASGLVHKGDRGGAIEIYESLLAEDNTVKAASRLGELYLAEGDLANARRVVGMLTYWSDDPGLLLVAAALNAEAGIVAPGQAEYCRQYFLDTHSYLAVDLTTSGGVTTAKSLAYLALGYKNRSWGLARSFYERAWNSDRGNPVVAWKLARAMNAEDRKDALRIAKQGMARATGAIKKELVEFLRQWDNTDG